MAQVKLTALEAVEVTASEGGRIELKFMVGGVPVVKKSILWHKAAELGDALSEALAEAVKIEARRA